MSEQEFTDRWWRHAERDPIHVTAAGWFTRLQDPRVSLETTIAWQQWMGEDARHAEAFARLEEVWNTIGEVSTRGLAPPGAEDDSYDGSLPLSDLKAPSFLRRYQARFAVAACLLSAALLTLAAINGTWLTARHPVRILSTSIGENRSVRLEDGSRVMLGGRTELEIMFQNDSRRIALVRGEAFFRVAKDPNRPFVVQAGDAAMTAVGTEFDVRRGEDRVTVAVVEGRIVVEPSSRLVPVALLREFRPKLVPVQLDAGEQTIINEAGIQQATTLLDTSTPTAWQSGRLVYDGEPLRYVLADVNRYAAKPIVTEDQGIGSLKITGTVSSDNVREWTASLESAFGLAAVEEPGRIVLRRGMPK